MKSIPERIAWVGMIPLMMILGLGIVLIAFLLVFRFSVGAVERVEPGSADYSSDMEFVVQPLDEGVISEAMADSAENESGEAEGNTPTATSSPTLTFTPTLTPTYTSSPTATATDTPVPTATRFVPTATSKPTKKPTKVPTKVPTKEPTATKPPPPPQPTNTPVPPTATNRPQPTNTTGPYP
jgi:outer membrane biosynthesis protein TonB